MKLQLSRTLVNELSRSLAKAGSNEIGGQLFGEMLAPSHFRVTDITRQKRQGSFARFLVDLLQAARDAAGFYDKTSHQYHRFNYLGEWHSHPSFAVKPSSVDIGTMEELVVDPDFKGSFAVLMITKLHQGKTLLGAWLFTPLGDRVNVTIEVVED